MGVQVVQFQKGRFRFAAKRGPENRLYGLVARGRQTDDNAKVMARRVLLALPDPKAFSLNE